jgi:hypothetical protein
LIYAGASLDLQDSVGLTALMWAAGYDQPDTAQALVDAGANIFVRTHTALWFFLGKTARDLAQEAGQSGITSDVLQVLIKAEEESTRPQGEREL